MTENYAEIYSGLWGYNSALTAGAIAVSDVGLVVIKLVAGTVPNRTAVTFDMFVPTIATGVPPVE